MRLTVIQGQSVEINICVPDFLMMTMRYRYSLLGIKPPISIPVYPRRRVERGYIKCLFVTDEGEEREVMRVPVRYEGSTPYVGCIRYWTPSGERLICIPLPRETIEPREPSPSPPPEILRRIEELRERRKEMVERLRKMFRHREPFLGTL